MCFMNLHGQKLLRSSIRCLSAISNSKDYYTLSYTNTSNPILLDAEKTLYQTTPFVFLNNNTDKTNFELQVFPNPSIRYFNISTNMTDFNYKITDCAGRLILSGNSKNIDMLSCSSGVYCLNIYSNNQFKISSKIILQ